MTIPNMMPLSPKTTLTGSMAIGAAQVTVADDTAFPAAPFLAIITGEDNPDFSSWDVSDYEVIEVKEVSGSTLKQIDRAVEGTARAWPAGSWIMCGAVAELFRRLGVAITGATDDIEDLAGEGRTTETVKENADALDAHKADYATHLTNYADPHFYEDEGEDPEWAGVKYRLVMIDGEPFMEVVDA